MSELENIEKFVREFFSNLKCNLSNEGDILKIENVPRSFEDLFGKKGPYRLCFSRNVSDAEYVIKGSPMLNSIMKYLEGSNKATILRIDFDDDFLEEVSKIFTLKNCEVHSITRKHKNHFFSRFTFMTTLGYLKESEQFMNEIYIHNGKIIDGDLTGYKVIEGTSDDFSKRSLENDYGIAREFLKGTLKSRVEELGKILRDLLVKEVEKINTHYDSQLKSLGGNLNSSITEIKKIEEKIKESPNEDKEILNLKLERLRKDLARKGDDEARPRILKEREFTIKDAQNRYSLKIENKVLNTTVIYYPIFLFNIFLKGDSSGRYFEMSYDPLTKELDKIFCESCGTEVKSIGICSSGHIACEKCLSRCGECSASLCGKCSNKSCSACGKSLCRKCAIICSGCGTTVCKNHLRQDCVSGEDKCVRCLRACMRCHGLSDPKNFREALDGSKVCQKCLGEEKRNKVLKGIFKE